MLKENRSEKKDNLNSEVVDRFNEKYLHAIIDLEKKCFPMEWQYEDAEEYYKKMLGDKRNINAFLSSEKRIAGYILAKPHDEMVEELKKYDQELNFNDGKYYIETIQILPEARGSGGAKKLLISVCEEAKKRGIKKFSIHARITNGFNDKIKKIFDGKITNVRKIESWKPAHGESYEYIEWSY